MPYGPVLYVKSDRLLLKFPNLSGVDRHLTPLGKLRSPSPTELKHCRLAMGAWLGCVIQAGYTHEGPVANVVHHVSDPSHVFFGGAVQVETSRIPR